MMVMGARIRLKCASYKMFSFGLWTVSIQFSVNGTVKKKVQPLECCIYISTTEDVFRQQMAAHLVMYDFCMEVCLGSFGLYISWF